MQSSSNITSTYENEIDNIINNYKTQLEVIKTKSSITNTSFPSQNQTQTTSHNTKESDIAIYATIKFECDNLIQPVLTALNSLFYVFDVGEKDDYYSL